MNCPICLQEGREVESRVEHTNRSKNRAATGRRRRCSGNPAHTFRTLELVLKPSLDNLYVRASSDHSIMGKFSISRLREDIAIGVLKRLSDAELDSVTADVTAQLEEDLPRIAEPLSPEEAEEFQPVGIANSVSDYHIRTLVEHRLRPVSDRPAHVLYVLSFRGRVDTRGRGREGFRNARAFLDWFDSDDAYPDQRQAVPAMADRAVEEWWPPRAPVHPERVIKADGSEKQFGFEQFRGSLLRALLGRHDAERASLLIAQLVLFRLEGQSKVRSSQLASEAIAALRMHDDIAYLRYAGIAKSYKSSRDFRAEAVALLVHPSPRIVFTKTRLRPALGPSARQGNARPIAKSDSAD